MAPIVMPAVTAFSTFSIRISRSTERPLASPWPASGREPTPEPSVATLARPQALAEQLAPTWHNLTMPSGWAQNRTPWNRAAEARHRALETGGHDALRANFRGLSYRPLPAAARPVYVERIGGAAGPDALCHRQSQGQGLGEQERGLLRTGRRNGLSRPRVRPGPDSPLGSHGLHRALRRRQERHLSPERPRAPPEGPGPRRRAGRGALRDPGLDHPAQRSRGRGGDDPHL